MACPSASSPANTESTAAPSARHSPQPNHHPRKKPVRTAPRLDPYKPAIDEMLTYDLTAPRKQRHTATRILARLRDEHGATDLSYATVRD